MTNVVTVKKTTLRLETIQRGLAQSQEVRDKLEKEFRQFSSRQIVKTTNTHFREAIRLAAKVMGEGMPGTDDSGTHSVSSAGGTISLGFWSRLTKRYQERKRVTRPGTDNLFWKFSGGSSLYLYKLSTAIKTATVRSVKAQAASSGQSNKTVRITSTLNSPATGDPTMDGILRRSFVNGVMQVPEILSDDVQGWGKALSRAGIVANTEKRRPLVSKVAAGLGNQLRVALGKIKQ